MHRHNTLHTDRGGKEGQIKGALLNLDAMVDLYLQPTTRWVLAVVSDRSIRNPAATQRSNPSTPETVARTIHTSAKNQSQQVSHASQNTIGHSGTGQASPQSYEKRKLTAQASTALFSILNIMPFSRLRIPILGL